MMLYDANIDVPIGKERNDAITSYMEKRFVTAMDQEKLYRSGAIQLSAPSTR